MIRLIANILMINMVIGADGENGAEKTILNPWLDKALSARFLASSVQSNITAEQWNNMTIKQRLVAYDWNKELMIIAIILGYMVLYWIGVKSNQSQINRWINNVGPILREQFFQFGVSKSELYIADSASNFTTYATGRLNIESFIARFKLLGRDNFITLSMEYIAGFLFGGGVPCDRTEIIITLDKTVKVQPMIFAIVNKEYMKQVREENYFLSLVRTSDSTNLPVHLTYMSESAEIAGLLETPELEQALESSQHVLQYLAITDQGSSRPEKASDIESKTRIILALRMPSTKIDNETTKNLINEAIELADRLVALKPLRPDLIKKIKALREQELKKLNKALDDQKAEDLAYKKAEQKRQEARSNMSPAEQKKALAKEEKRRLKKQQKRQMR